MNFDPAKNAANIANHGLDLSFSDRVMADGQALHALDDSFRYIRCAAHPNAKRTSTSYKLGDAPPNRMEGPP